MTVNYKGQTFMTDNDLDVSEIGTNPKWNIMDDELREIFQRDFGRDFLAGDEIIGYRQSLVAGEKDFRTLENEILADIKNSGRPLRDMVFDKIATGVGRGHSMGGLAEVSLWINGTKMIDSGLTGLVASRSLVTSSRRRGARVDEIVIPESLLNREDLVDEYLEISRGVFDVSELFKREFGESKGKELFNKLIPYNNPANLYYKISLDTMATLAFEVKNDKLNKNSNFIPRELWKLVDMFPNLAEKAGIGVMYKQRVQVPRDTYFHYTVFKDPALPNYALENARMRDMPLCPIVIDVYKDFTAGFRKGLRNLEAVFRKTRMVNNPEELADKSMESMFTLRDFVGEYNGSLRLTISDSLSWRVWSEQKRHATLRQNVESVYSAAERAYKILKPLWLKIKRINNGELDLDSKLIEKFEKAIFVDNRLKKKNELFIPYIYHTARQLMFYGKLIEDGFEARDALYIVPKNIRVRTLESYDLINLIDLEHPLRLCSTCEPERYATSWEKRRIIADVVPELKFFLEPKCNIGYCTEGRSCGHVSKLRKGNYSEELHKGTKRVILSRAR